MSSGMCRRDDPGSGSRAMTPRKVGLSVSRTYSSYVSWPTLTSCTCETARSDVDSTVVNCRANVSPTISRSEEHTSELQSLMRISYAVFCLKKKNTQNIIHSH